VFVPIFDENPLRVIRAQFITMVLIALNVAVYAVEVTGLQPAIIASFAVVPAELFGTGFADRMGASRGLVAVPEHLTVLTYMFFHGDVLHLASNMLFLWVFGDNVEDALGHLRFLLFYLLCGAAAGLVHAAMLPNSRIALIGASGAVAGVIAAYLMLHPRVKIWVIVLRFIPLRISAALALGAWIATQVVMVLIPEIGPIAWWAHIGGLLAGAVLVVFLRRPGVILFDRALV
jgi:membrane associated rhomboid family serine protease